MKKTHKIAAFAALPVLGLSLFGVTAASAQGLGGGQRGFGGMFGKNSTPEEIVARQTDLFADQASLLGISVDEVKTAWAEGTGLKELAAAHGITAEQLQAKRKASAEARIKSGLQTLVDKGVVTQAQADKRFETMKIKMETMPKRGMFRHARGVAKTAK